VECPFSGRKSATGENQKLVDISTKLFSKKISQRLKHIKKNLFTKPEMGLSGDAGRRSHGQQPTLTLTLSTGPWAGRLDLLVGPA
jgi:hypothetical protein